MNTNLFGNTFYIEKGAEISCFFRFLRFIVYYEKIKMALSFRCKEGN